MKITLEEAIQKKSPGLYLERRHRPTDDFGAPYFEVKAGAGFYGQDEGAPDIGGRGFNLTGIISQYDAAYLVHAANVLPQVVEALKSCGQYDSGTVYCDISKIRTALAAAQTVEVPE